MTWVMCCNLILHGGTPQGFFQPKREQNEIVWIIGGGKYIFVYKACGKIGVSRHAAPESFPVENCLVCMCFDSERSLKHDHK